MTALMTSACLPAKSCSTLCNPMDGSLPGSSVHSCPAKNTGVGFHAPLRRLSPSRDRTHVSCIAGKLSLYNIHPALPLLTLCREGNSSSRDFWALLGSGRLPSALLNQGHDPERVSSQGGYQPTTFLFPWSLPDTTGTSNVGSNPTFLMQI